MPSTQIQKKMKNIVEYGRINGRKVKIWVYKNMKSSEGE